MRAEEKANQINIRQRCKMSPEKMVPKFIPNNRRTLPMGKKFLEEGTG